MQMCCIKVKDEIHNLAYVKTVTIIIIKLIFTAPLKTWDNPYINISAL